jgi:hypothetical protein
MLTYEQMIDHLDNIEQTVAPYCDDAEDLNAAIIEAIDKALFRGAIDSVVHEKLCWQFGVEI